MSDLDGQIAISERNVVKRPIDGGAGTGVVLERLYDAPIAAVWTALTKPERVRRWFLPVRGDLRADGPFQTEGKAGGEILGATHHTRSTTPGSIRRANEQRGRSSE